MRMRNLIRWSLAMLMAAIAVITLGPEATYARGGGGGGGGGGRGGSRGGRGGSRGGRGGSPGGRGGASRGGRGGNKTSKSKFDGKDVLGYLEQIQQEEADYMRDDFIFGSRDESLVDERDKSRRHALSADRNEGARARRIEQERGSHPY